MVIDDDVTTRKILTNALTNLGHWTIESANGRHAWETLWENQDIGLVVTDMFMPDMDGGELTQLIRGNSTFEGLPIIIVSGVLEPSDVQPFLRFQRCAFLQKPIDIAQFKALVGEFAALSGGR